MDSAREHQTISSHHGKVRGKSSKLPTAFLPLLFLTVESLRSYATESSKKFVRDKPHMNIGTIGHVGECVLLMSVGPHLS
jgi:hypothetical protein